MIDDEIKPLYCGGIHRGSAALGGITSGIFAPVDLIAFRSLKKREGQQTPRKKSV